MGQRDLPTSMTIDQEFPRKVSHGKCGSFFALQNFGEDDNIMGKVAKGKKKKYDKKRKAGQNAEKQDQESTYSLRNTLIAEISSLGEVYL